MNEQKTVNLLVSGEVACFRRPEFSDDLVTYDVMPLTVARRLVEAAFPSIYRSLLISKIVVMNQIRSRWQDIKTARGSRRALVLLDVSYLIQATVSSAVEAGRDNQLPSASETLSQPVKAHLGLADFPAKLSLPLGNELPKSVLIGSGPIDLGWMLCDTARGSVGQFFRLTMTDGEIDFARQNDLRRAS